MGQRIIKNIPEDKVEEIFESIESEGCTAVKKRQSNGLYTIIAECPEDLINKDFLK